MDYITPMITPVDLEIARVMRKFVDKEIMPIRTEIDDDNEHLLINRIFRKLATLGFDGGVSLADSYGRRDKPISYVTSAVITEELSRGDVGIGIVSAINGWALMPAYVAKNDRVMRLYQEMLNNGNPSFACFAMTEPQSGCDIENIAFLHGKTIRSTATRDGDSWIINGTKVFASNAGIASIYCITCQTDILKGEEGIALIYVPAGSEGLSLGQWEKKAGLQADRNATIFLDNVRVPLDYRAAQDGRDAELLINNLAIGRVSSAAAAIGCARGAFEEVLRYSGERVVAGKAIRDHSIAAAILAEMATGIETARCYCHQVAYMLSNSQEYGSDYSNQILSRASICKNYAAEIAISVTNRAMELMGSYGYIRDYKVEKYWRDVKEIQLWLGGPQLGKLDIVRGYYPYQG